MYKFEEWKTAVWGGGVAGGGDFLCLPMVKEKTFSIHTASSLLHLSVLCFTLCVSMLVHVQQDFNNRNLVSISLEHVFSK